MDLSAWVDLLVCGSSRQGRSRARRAVTWLGSAKEGEGAIGHPERAIASLFGISSVVLEPLGV